MTQVYPSRNRHTQPRLPCFPEKRWLGLFLERYHPEKTSRNGDISSAKTGVKSGQSISSQTETEESPLLGVMQERALVLQSMASQEQTPDNATCAITRSLLLGGHAWGPTTMYRSPWSML